MTFWLCKSHPLQNTASFEAKNEISKCHFRFFNLLHIVSVVQFEKDPRTKCYFIFKVGSIGGEDICSDSFCMAWNSLSTKPFRRQMTCRIISLRNSWTCSTQKQSLGKCTCRVSLGDIFKTDHKAWKFNTPFCTLLVCLNFLLRWILLLLCWIVGAQSNDAHTRVIDLTIL